MNAKYDTAWLKAQVEQEQRIKYVFFWGHQAKHGASVDKSCFSQWYASTFEVDGKLYRTAEHWMMEQKALLFDDTPIAEAILQANSPAEAKELGRKVKGFEQKKWSEHRVEIVVQGNYHKFGQHPELKEFLLNTSERVLVEASPVDPVWGIGLAVDDERVGHVDQWKGSNLLGFALMEVRDRLREG